MLSLFCCGARRPTADPCEAWALSAPRIISTADSSSLSLPFSGRRLTGTAAATTATAAAAPLAGLASAKPPTARRGSTAYSLWGEWEGGRVEGAASTGAQLFEQPPCLLTPGQSLRLTCTHPPPHADPVDGSKYDGLWRDNTVSDPGQWHSKCPPSMLGRLCCCQVNSQGRHEATASATIPAAEPEAGRQQGLASAAPSESEQGEPEPTERKATSHLEVKCQHPPCRHCRQWFLCAVPGQRVTARFWPAPASRERQHSGSPPTAS